MAKELSKGNGPAPVTVSADEQLSLTGGAASKTLMCPAPPNGMWTCRLVQYDDVRGAVALYGGTVKPWHGSSFCNR